MARQTDIIYGGAAANDGSGTTLRATSYRINDFVARTYSATWQARVLGTESTPPATPANGDRYIVGSSPTGAWAAIAPGTVVEWFGVPANPNAIDPGEGDGVVDFYPKLVWVPFVPQEGHHVYDAAMVKVRRWDGSDWVDAFSALSGLTSDDLANGSGVAGETTSDALDALDAALSIVEAALTSKADLVAGKVPLSQLQNIPQSQVTGLVTGLADIDARIVALETGSGDGFDFVTVASEAARLALPVSAKNRIVKQLDTSGVYGIENGADPSNPANWTFIVAGAPGATVGSVFGRTGAVTAQAGDYNSAQINAGVGALAPGATVYAQIEGHESRIDAAEGTLSALPASADIHSKTRATKAEAVAADQVAIYDSDAVNAPKRIGLTAFRTDGVHIRPVAGGTSEPIGVSFPSTGSVPSENFWRYTPSSGPVTITLGALNPASASIWIAIALVQPAGGGVTFSFSTAGGATIKWVGGAAPTIDTTANAETIVSGYYIKAANLYVLSASEAAL